MSVQTTMKNLYYFPTIYNLSTNLMTEKCSIKYVKNNMDDIVIDGSANAKLFAKYLSNISKGENNVMPYFEPRTSVSLKDFPIDVVQDCNGLLIAQQPLSN